MLDEFRQQANSSFFEEAQEEQPEPAVEYQPPRKRGHFLGLTPVQRFVIVMMLFILVCLIGSLGLLVTERVIPVVLAASAAYL